MISICTTLTECYRDWLNERVLSFSLPRYFSTCAFCPFSYTRSGNKRAILLAFSPPSNLHNEQSRGDLNFESEEQTPCITQTKLLDESVNMAESGASASKFVINLNSAAVYISSGARWPLIEIIFLPRQGETMVPFFSIIYLSGKVPRVLTSRERITHQRFCQHF